MRSLERGAERSRVRLRNAALLLPDGSIDKVQADHNAAEAEVTRVREEKPARTLRSLVEVLKAAGDWGRVQRETDVPAHRDVLRS
jgi:hypothetical protein